MKIIQSFWSKPFFHPSADHHLCRAKGGFTHEKYFYYCWMLSFLTLKQRFKEIHLITDEAGKKLLCDKLGLKYTSVSTELDALNGFQSDFWAIGKLYVFLKVKEPFLHIDGDLVIGKTFQLDENKSKLMAEFSYLDIYSKKYLATMQQLSDELLLPDEIKHHIKKIDFYYKDFNAGIIGGYDYEFFNQFARTSLSFLEKNLIENRVKDRGIASFLNCFFEQFMFRFYAEKEQINVHLLIQQPIMSDSDYQKKEILLGFDKMSFVHFHNVYKLQYASTIELWLKRNFYTEYQRINALNLW
jgi:hypothetical protein